MKPALTAEEWDRYERIKNSLDDGDYLGAAALCLHGHPSGFTHRHLAAIQWWQSLVGFRLIAKGYPEGSFGHIIQEIADRIAALLPPMEDDDAD